ncbi:MAG: hypothetical protein EOO67_12830 [Microbacterium sp.]|nr:MAG: hypothetical protein EOO67_12830 [Microbacterium sp.]
MVAETARRMIEVVKSDPLTWQPILLTPHGMPQEVRTRIDGDRDRVTIQIAGLLELGLAIRGGPVLDAEVLAHAIVATLEHFGRILLTEPDRFETDRLVATIVGLLNALK